MASVLKEKFFLRQRRTFKPKILRTIDLSVKKSIYSGLLFVREYYFKKEDLDKYFARKNALMKLPRIGPKIKISRSMYKEALKKGKYLDAKGDFEEIEIRELRREGEDIIYTVIIS